MMKNSIKDIKSFPLSASFLLMICSLFLSNYFAHEKHTSSMFLMILSQYLVVFIFWQLYRTSPMMVTMFFVKALLTLGFIISFYSLFETITKTNPLVRFFVNVEAYSSDSIIDEIRFGLKRSQGVFSMHTTNAGIALISFATLYVCRFNGYIKHKLINNAMIALLFMTVFFTGARSGIAALMISLPMFLDKRSLSVKCIFLLCLLGFILSIGTSGYLSSIIDAFVDTEKVGGSNTNMRENQLDISLAYLMQSPIFGNGIQYTFTTVKILDEDINGAESIWFTAMIDQGLLGVFAYIMYYVSCIWYCFKCGYAKFSFFVIAFLVFYTMSSIPNVPVTYTFIYLFMMVEIQKNRFQDLPKNRIHVS